MARVYNGESTFLERVFNPVEHLIYRLAGSTQSGDELENIHHRYFAVQCNRYVRVICIAALPERSAAQPAGFRGVSPDSSFSTAVSFVSNTNCKGTVASGR